MRVAFVLRSVEVQPLCRDLCVAQLHQSLPQLYTTQTKTPKFKKDLEQHAYIACFWNQSLDLSNPYLCPGTSTWDDCYSFTYSKSGLFSTYQPLHHTRKESHTQRERTQCTNYATNPCLTLSTVPLPHTSGFRSDQRHSKRANVAKTHHVLPKVPLFIRVIIIIITTNLHTYPRLTECLLLPHTSGL